MSTNNIEQVRARLEALESAVEAIDAERSELKQKLLEIAGEKKDIDGLLAGTWDIGLNARLSDSGYGGWHYDANGAKGSVEGNLLFLTAMANKPPEADYGAEISVAYCSGTIEFTFNFGEIEFYFTGVTDEEVLRFFKDQNMFIRMDTIVDERNALQNTSKELSAIIASLTSNGTARMGPNFVDLESERVMGGSFGYEEPVIFDGSFGGHFPPQPAMPYPVFADDWRPRDDWNTVQDTTAHTGAEDAIYNNIPDEEVDAGMDGVSYWNMIDALSKDVADIIRFPNATAEGVLTHVEHIKQQVESIKAEFEDKYMK